MICQQWGVVVASGAAGNYCTVLESTGFAGLKPQRPVQRLTGKLIGREKPCGGISQTMVYWFRKQDGPSDNACRKVAALARGRSTNRWPRINFSIHAKAPPSIGLRYYFAATRSTSSQTPPSRLSIHLTRLRILLPLSRTSKSSSNRQYQKVALSWIWD